MKTFNTETYSRLAAIAQSIQTGSNANTIALIDALITQKKAENKPAWIREMGKLRAIIATGKPAYPIFKLDGNSKLPFAAFSSLPGVTCPGAGSCLEWCYSFKAWRYPAAFARMAQNAWMMIHNPQTITQAFQTLPESMTLRLYVDGDFASGSDVSFWMERLRARPDVQAYGYSKSFTELLTYYREWPYFPKNYILNLSGGHNHSAETLDKMQALPITRGTFDAVSIGRKVKSTDHGKPETNRAIRAQAGKVFPCPGQCGSCTPKGHACGSERFRNIPIVIAVH
jgi:glutaredoxin-related protein